MTLDAHLHLWDLEHGTYSWLSDAVAPINRTFRFEEVEPQLRATGVDRVVLVQAAGTSEDSAAMFAVAAQQPMVAGVVAWVDLRDPSAVGDALDSWAAAGPLVGIRHLIHDEADPDWLAQPAVHRSLAVLASRGLAYDVIGVLPRHLEHAVALADELPELRLVVDHLGTPPVGSEAGEWGRLIDELGSRPNVFVKLSGLTTLGPAGRASAGDLRPYVDRALDAFGPSRMLYGGDWPVSTLATPYAETFAVARELIAALTPAERDDILAGSAARAYRLP
ncbi:amidohydrolase family protein [Leifsonia virtsii]|uniref:Amidohydrolase family protein n=1 Tax=Leifsonia virtsii TaxID=3035915 RepID=A0ABT8IWP6_9MICO|nr:amidohydrolase family protein [Leifsonia virtsii]MDN4597235.1 amidohydrolase family protein [Leifsonia virtsii]